MPKSKKKRKKKEKKKTGSSVEQKIEMVAERYNLAKQCL
jgi:hypothetical protein